MVKEQNTNSAKLEKLKRQADILKARIQKEESRFKQRLQKEETRRKILLGAFYLEKFHTEGNFESIKNELDSFLIRNADRKLFNLPLLDSDIEQIENILL